MPHFIVKLFPGRTEKQKTKLAQQILHDVVTTLNLGEESVSIAFEEVKPADWLEKVYKPDVEAHWEKLYKKPNYDPSDL